MDGTRRGIKLTDESLADARLIATAYRTSVSGAARIALAEVAERLRAGTRRPLCPDPE